MHLNHKFSSTPNTHQQGFSLVEIMVGLVIGLVVTLAVMQVFSVFEGQKRSTMGTADAQTNGNIALYNIQRDVQLAGFGLPMMDAANPPMRCTSLATAALSPVTITDGGAAAGASDTLVVRYGNSASAGIPAVILAGGVVKPSPSLAAPTARVNVSNNMGCAVGDVVMVTRGTACVIVGTTAAGGALALPDNTHIDLRDGSDASIQDGASVSCLGNWASYTYSITSNQLARQVNAGTVDPNVAEIVNMQAQYGVSASGLDNKITSWVPATGATWGATLTQANRNRIKAIRVAIVARNGLLEKEVVSTACSGTDTANPTGVCAWEGAADNPAPTIDLSNIASWDHYRYRVYETIIPIRSIIWNKDRL